MIDLSTQQKKDAVVSNLKTLLVHPGWVIFEQIARENIEVVKNQILEGGKEQTIEEVNRLRDKLAVHVEMIDMPKNMIESLAEQTSPAVENDDPYETAK